jgi:hypothetical protein
MAWNCLFTWAVMSLLMFCHESGEQNIDGTKRFRSLWVSASGTVQQVSEWFGLPWAKYLNQRSVRGWALILWQATRA